MHLERMKVTAPLAEWVAKNKLDGVMLTHMHLDHISGMPDVPHGTPLLEVRRVAYSYHQTPVEVRISHVNTERYEYVGPSASHDQPL